MSITVPVNFIVIYDTKKFSYFLSNKDKIPNLSKSNVVYEVKCPGCSATYIGKTERFLQSRLSEHINPTASHSSWEICLSMHQISLRERVEIALFTRDI